MSDVTQIVRPLHPKDRLPFYSLAELLIPFKHPVFMMDMDLRNEPKKERLEKLPAKKDAYKRPPRAVLATRYKLREDRIENLLADGKNVREISCELNLDEKTVRSSIRRRGLKLPGEKEAKADFLRTHGDEIRTFCNRNGIHKTSKHYGSHYMTIKSFMERQK